MLPVITGLSVTGGGVGGGGALRISGSGILPSLAGGSPPRVPPRVGSRETARDKGTVPSSLQEIYQRYRGMFEPQNRGSSVREIAGFSAISDSRSVALRFAHMPPRVLRDWLRVPLMHCFLPGSFFD